MLSSKDSFSHRSFFSRSTLAFSFCIRLPLLPYSVAATTNPLSLSVNQSSRVFQGSIEPLLVVQVSLPEEEEEEFYKLRHCNQLPHSFHVLYIYVKPKPHVSSHTYHLSRSYQYFSPSH